MTENKNDSVLALDELKKFIDNVEFGEYTCKKQDDKVVLLKITQNKKP